MLVNSRKERSVAAALCYLTALPAVILLGLYCQASVVGRGRTGWRKRDGEKDRCIRKQGASVPPRLAGWLARSLARSLVLALPRLRVYVRGEANPEGSTGRPRYIYTYISPCVVSACPYTRYMLVCTMRSVSKCVRVYVCAWRLS